MDIQFAINWLRVNEGLILPHGLLPRTYPGGIDTEFSQQEWEAWGWNPITHPETLTIAPTISGIDPDASLIKPTWVALMAADGKSKFGEARLNLLYELNIECTNRVAKLYHPRGHLDRNKEWQVRLSGSIPLGADETRVRLISVHTTLKAQAIAASSMAELGAINPGDDSTWASKLK